MSATVQIVAGVGAGLTAGAAAGVVDLFTGAARIGRRADEPDRPLLVLGAVAVAGVAAGVALGAPALMIAAGVCTLLAGYLAGWLVLGVAKGY